MVYKGHGKDDREKTGKFRSRPAESTYTMTTNRSARFCDNMTERELEVRRPGYLSNCVQEPSHNLIASHNWLGEASSSSAMDFECPLPDEASPIESSGGIFYTHHVGKCWIGVSIEVDHSGGCFYFPCTL